MREFIAWLREEKGLKREKLCTGLCSFSQYQNYENGKRELDVFVEKRIMERMGCSTEDIQYVLGIKDYECWKRRTIILQELLAKNQMRTIQEIEAFETLYASAPIHRQYALRMRSFVAIQKKEPPAMILQYVKEALRCTVPDYEEAGKRNQLLAAQEMDMLLDYQYYQEPSKADRFHEMATAIMESQYEDTEKEKVFPKAVLYYLHALEMEKSIDQWEFSHFIECYQMVTKALELMRLRKTGRYMRCILLWREQLLQELIQHYGLEKDYKDAKQQNDKWLNALQCAEQYINSCGGEWNPYGMYLMGNVEFMGNVVACRMEMFSLSDARLAAEMGVDKRTIRSVREGKQNPQKQLAANLMLRLGLPPHYSMTSFYFRNGEQKDLINHLYEELLYGQKKGIEELLKQMEVSLDMEGVFEHRKLRWHKILDAYRKGTFTKGVIAKKIQEIIEECFPFKCLGESEKLYFSQNELEYLYSYLQRMNQADEKNKWLIDRMLDYLEQKLESVDRMSYLVKASVGLNIIQSILGNLGEYERSNALCEEVIRIAKEDNNLHEVEEILYSLWWNKKAETGMAEWDMLFWLIDLANLLKDEWSEEFYRKVLKGKSM